MQLALVYQFGLANIFDITPPRCPSCLDRPGVDGLGRTCKTCGGSGSLAAARKRLLQSSFAECEAFIRGAVTAGAACKIWHCDQTGNIETLIWKRGAGEMFTEHKRMSNPVRPACSDDGSVLAVPIPGPLLEGHKVNFATLKQAHDDGNLALVSGIRVADREPVALICAMSSSEDGKLLRPVPLGEMVNGNPYELYYDPTIGKPEASSPRK